MVRILGWECGVAEDALFFYLCVWMWFRTWGHSLVMTCYSQGSPTLKRTALYCVLLLLFWNKLLPLQGGSLQKSYIKWWSLSHQPTYKGASFCNQKSRHLQAIRKNAFFCIRWCFSFVFPTAICMWYFICSNNIKITSGTCLIWREVTCCSSGSCFHCSVKEPVWSAEECNKSTLVFPLVIVKQEEILLCKRRWNNNLHLK